MRIKDLVDHCTYAPILHCGACEHVEECERYKTKYGTIPFLEDSVNKQFEQIANEEI